MTKEKTRRASRLSTDEKIYGDEPQPGKGLPVEVTNIELVRLLNWYNARRESEDARKFALVAYPELAKEIRKVNEFELRTIGWVARLQTNGFIIPAAVKEKMAKRLANEIAKAQAKAVEKIEIKEEKETPFVRITISPAERIKRKSSELIAELEEIIDSHIRDPKFSFKAYEWMVKKEINHLHAKAIMDRYTEWAKESPFVKDIYDSAKRFSENAKVVRKVRKKKVKSADVLTKTFQYRPREDSLKLVSVSPADIIGATEVWTYNVEKRFLHRYVAIDKTPLTVKGTTILGFDEKLSGGKKIRKPEEFFKTFSTMGKRDMKKAFDAIKAKAMEIKGRTNTETVILKVSK